MLDSTQVSSAAMVSEGSNAESLQYFCIYQELGMAEHGVTVAQLWL